MSRTDRPRVGARHLARECALQVLYQLDWTGSADVDEALALYWASRFPEGGATDELDPPEADEAKAFAEQLVRGTVAHLPDIDRTLVRVAQHWRLERMAKVDRNVLRLATFELVHAGEVPARVVLNEAIELAKRFGSEESGAFVNGILDRIAHETRP